MKMINIELKDKYIVRVYLDDDSIVDFDVKAEIARIPCYKSLYNKALFKSARFNNKRIFWNDQCDFHLDHYWSVGIK